MYFLELIIALIAINYDIFVMNRGTRKNRKMTYNYTAVGTVFTELSAAILYDDDFSE